MGRVTKDGWLRMRMDYEDGVFDLSELAVQCGLTLDTVKKHANEEGWQRPETDRTVRRLKNHRVQMLEAICNSTMEGLRKADDLLSECDCLRDVETHSKTVKNYKDICIGKSPDEFLKEETQADRGIAEMMAELDNLSSADTQAILNEAD